MYEIALFIYRFVKSYSIKLLHILFMIIGTTYIAAMYPYLYGKMVDTLFYQGDMTEFIRYIGIYFCLFFINQFLHFILDMITVKTRTSLQKDVKCHIFRKILSYQGNALSNLKSGDVIYRMNHDADEFMNLIYSDLFYGISALLDFIICVGMTAWINIYLAFVSVFLATATFFIGKHFSLKVKKVRKEFVSKLAENQAWLSECLQCMQDVRLLCAAKNVINIYLRRDIASIRLGIKQSKYEAVADRSNIAMQFLCTVCMYAVSAILISAGLMTLGGMIACIDYFERIVLLLSRISKRFVTIPNRLVAIERVMDVDKIESEKYNDDLPMRPISLGKVQMNNVFFSYEGKKEVLKGVTLELSPGKTLALVGKSGEGKSTIAQLLCRVYEVSDGDITIDGVSIKEYNLHDLRNQVGIAYQNAMLFENTIRYNLIFSNKKDRDNEIWTTLETIKLAEFVRGLPSGLDTKLVPTKQQLSGGQKQRIAIARLLLKKTPIVIFDESTSSLDRETEQNILDSWSDLLKGKTVLIIAHRLATIIHADKVAFLEEGKIIGCDRHERLLENCMSYKQLFLSQIQAVKQEGD